MNEQIRLTLAFGAMSNPIEKQLQGKGLTLGMSAPKYERAADSIVFLVIHGFITPSAADSARKKMMKEIARSARALS
jgi:hypothetical protein